MRMTSQRGCTSSGIGFPGSGEARPTSLSPTASAAALHRLGTIIPQLPTVTVPPGAGISPRVADVDVHRAPLRDIDWAWSDVGALKLPVTTPARTIVDLLLDKQEPSYVVRAAYEALTEGLTTPAELMDTARHRKSPRRSTASPHGFTAGAGCRVSWPWRSPQATVKR